MVRVGPERLEVADAVHCVVPNDAARSVRPIGSDDDQVVLRAVVRSLLQLAVGERRRPLRRILMVEAAPEDLPALLDVAFVGHRSQRVSLGKIGFREVVELEVEEV